jgi:uncharacterized protein (TIGR00255 family)
MTGFGAAEGTTGLSRYAVEIRSVNHRFCEIVVRLPREFAPLEDQVRAIVQGRVLRGRVDVAIIRQDHGKRTRAVKADLDLATAYASALNDLKRALSISGPLDLPTLVSLPDLIRIEEQKEDLEVSWAALATGIADAVDRLVAMRDTEGARLGADLARRVERLDEHIGAIEGRAPSVVEEYHARLVRRVAELTTGVTIDPGRLATEIAMFADRTDVTEEITRFRSHLVQFQSTLNADGAVGRTLEFIVQELGREANTIGSKANDLAITRRVIAVKGELESLREQIQNVE